MKGLFHTVKLARHLCPNMPTPHARPGLSPCPNLHPPDLAGGTTIFFGIDLCKRSRCPRPSTLLYLPRQLSTHAAKPYPSQLCAYQRTPTLSLPPSALPSSAPLVLIPKWLYLG